ncbi:hypothetical protein K469DRAFT_705990 [Zopfia rhizophila CBS 207.26]|uniref:Uncharacterized protein n=1 Tax=Zopfia rhizophila CBS 207.26 TaxID=1314779 RepID=A0A6A6ESH5_9PEZI|nr:hypothetical protein K469DRAFT_705990 [Zopfia rhizophila CBS 207.26]
MDRCDLESWCEIVRARALALDVIPGKFSALGRPWRLPRSQLGRFQSRTVADFWVCGVFLVLGSYGGERGLNAYANIGDWDRDE